MPQQNDKEKSQKIQEKYQAALNAMLRDDDNKYCVDCDAKGPRWASWNIGVFLCIRCAGIHRNLGVHISKVKSVNLDSWTAEQVASIQSMGNSKARAVYEANLPDDFRRPQTDSPLEQFIRSKYEQRKWIAREWIPPNITISPDLTEEEIFKDTPKLASKIENDKKKVEIHLNESSQKNKISNKASTIVKDPPKNAEPEPIIDLLGMNDPSPNNSKTQSDNLNSGDSDSFFGPFISPNTNISTNTNNSSNIHENIDLLSNPTTTSTTNTNSNTNELENITNSNQNKTRQTIDKDSILALYNKTTNIPSQQIPIQNQNIMINPMLQHQNMSANQIQMPQNGMFLPMNMMQFGGQTQLPTMPQHLGINTMHQQPIFNQQLQQVPIQMPNNMTNLSQLQNFQVQNLQVQMNNMKLNQNAQKHNWQNQPPNRLPNLTPQTQNNSTAKTSSSNQTNLFNFSTNGNTLSTNLWQ